MKNIFSIFISLWFLTSCTTLNSAERCALIGQIHEGTHIGTRAQFGQIGNSFYSYPVTSYNPICKIPKTNEEKARVADILPQAKEKQKQRNTELTITYGAALITPFLLLLPLILEARQSNRRPYYYRY